MTPALEALPPQPEILCVVKPLPGDAVQVVVLPAVTGFTQLSMPFAPALAVTVYWRGAEQVAVAVGPTQLHAKLLAPEVTALAEPTLQRFALGATSVATPFALPQ